jgi:hypothetical protein
MQKRAIPKASNNPRRGKSHPPMRYKISRLQRFGDLRDGAMKSASAKLAWLALAGVAVVGLLALVGCQNQHPDMKQAVQCAESAPTAEC